MEKNKLKQSKLRLDNAIKEFDEAEKKLPNPKKKRKQHSKLTLAEKNFHEESKYSKINESNFYKEPKHKDIKIEKIHFIEPLKGNENVRNSLKESSFRSKLKDEKSEISGEANKTISKNEANRKGKNFISEEILPETKQSYYKNHSILVKLEDKNKYNLRVNTSFRDLPEPFTPKKLKTRVDVPNIKGFRIDSNNKKSNLNFGESGKNENIKKIATNPVNIISGKVQSQVHKKVEELEENDIGLEAVHRTEKSLEKGLALSKKAYRHEKMKPYVRVARAEEKLKKAKTNYSYQKYLYDNKLNFQKFNNNDILDSVSNFRQKQAVKRRYAKLYRKKYSNYSKYKSGYSVASKIVKKVATKIIQTIQKNPKIFIAIFVSFFLVFVICGVVSVTIITGQAIIQSFLGTSYTSSTDAMLETYENYQALENELKELIESIEDDYPSFDEYVYDIDNIGHNPHELTSYLSVIFKSYNAELVKAELENLFSLQYTLTIYEDVELRYDENGVPYQHKILTVELTNKSIKEIAYEVFDDEEYELFLSYLENKGNMPTLFDDIYSEDTNQDGSYQVPSNHLTDQEFAELLAEAEKYIGYPYVWGGSSPSTSFDCSGFICWVYGISRTTAQGVYNQCTVVSSSQAKPGDLVFFTGTYNSVGAVSHIGMYVGDGMMLHCGDPIGYASLTNSYWSSHFYAFARLNYD